MLKTYLKNLLGSKNVDRIFDLRVRLRMIYNKLILSNIVLVWLDTIFNSSYIRENRSVRYGMRDYFNSQYITKNNIYLLRRNIHRIEKGLLMKQRRSQFALSYLLDTIILMSNIDFTKSLEMQRWAVDVITKYFSETSSNDSRYLEAKDRFQLYVKTKIEYDVSSIRVPYKRISPAEMVSPSNLIQLFHYRKSIRWYDDSQKVPHNIIEDALEAASLSPSSCNRQPFKYYITTNKEKAAEIAKISAGTVGWADNVPNIAVLVGTQKAFGNIANRHSIYIDATLSVMPFILQLEASGVSSCLINWSDISFRDKKMRKILGLKNDESVIVSIAFGYSSNDGLVAYSQRSNINGIVEYV